MVRKQARWRQQHRRQWRVLGSGVVAEHISKPMPLGVLVCLRAVVQRVVQHEVTTPLGHHKVENSPRRSNGGDGDNQLAIQAIAAICLHFGRFPNHFATQFHER